MLTHIVFKCAHTPDVVKSRYRKEYFPDKTISTKLSTYVTTLSIQAEEDDNLKKATYVSITGDSRENIRKESLLTFNLIPADKL